LIGHGLIGVAGHGKEMAAVAEESDIVRWGVVRAAMGVAVLALTSFDAALAQGRLDARYAVTLAGIPIGKGTWVVDIAETQYTAVGSGATAGLLRIFAGGQGSGGARGSLTGGKFVPSSYAVSMTSDKRTEDIRITLGSGDVKDYEITPPLPPDPPESERVPLTEAHRRGVSDPMTASLVRVPGNGNPLVPKACERTAPIFDGRLRYNLQFAYKRMEQVKTDKGYEGPAVVCAVTFVPIAGYIPTRAAIKYLQEQRDIEIWLAPIGTTRVLVPYRISIPTPIGVGVMQATQFVALPPSPPQAAAAGPKTQ
jgi:uncharacterized protein DUF3108